MQLVASLGVEIKFDVPCHDMTAGGRWNRNKQQFPEPPSDSHVTMGAALRAVPLHETPPCGRRSRMPIRFSFVPGPGGCQGHQGTRRSMIKWPERWSISCWTIRASSPRYILLFGRPFSSLASTSTCHRFPCVCRIFRECTHITGNV